MPRWQHPRNRYRSIFPAPFISDTPIPVNVRLRAQSHFEFVQSFDFQRFRLILFCTSNVFTLYIHEFSKNCQAIKFGGGPNPASIAAFPRLPRCCPKIPRGTSQLLAPPPGHTVNLRTKTASSSEYSVLLGDLPSKNPCGAPMA